jgi:hypothetical protein
MSILFTTPPPFQSSNTIKTSEGKITQGKTRQDKTRKGKMRHEKR